MTDIKDEEVTGEKKSLNFIEQIVENDLKEGKNGGKVQTRFPPEPNGYLHIGHAKAICLDFGLAARHGGVCNLRFDDTNPTKEDVEYVEAIEEDIKWLGFEWGNVYYASDYFQQLWDFAVRLIQEGKAYIDEQTSEQIAAQKGTPTQPGTESPYRNRPVEESLTLFRKMNSGEIEEGAMVLRAKIDMANPNMHFRDPIIYRVVKHPHHRTGTTWKAYPMYDFAHGQSDFFEGVTHSLCTLEFVVHRPLYDLFIDWLKEGNDLNDNRPRQYEFNKLNLSYTLMSKRNLLTLVKEGLVNGWDDPRMPTICGFRRRGYSPESIRKFVDKIGYTTYDALNEFALLESAVREDLNIRATRVSAVLNPVKLIITNYPEGQSETFSIENNPMDENAGKRDITFSRDLWIEADDFLAQPVPKYKRLYPNGPECRLKGAYLIRCTGCVKDEAGNVVEVLCEYDPASKGGNPADGRKVKGATIHWVEADTAADAEVRLYDALFSDPAPDGPDKNFLDYLNPESLQVLTGCKVEQGLAQAALPEAGKTATSYQFMRQGYFCLDNRDAKPGHLVFNRSVSLKDSFKKK